MRSKNEEDSLAYDKILLSSASKLSDVELIALVLGRSTTTDSAKSIAAELLKKSEGKLEELRKLSATELSRYRGVSQDSAVALAAALELSSRMPLEECKVDIIKNSMDVENLLMPLLATLHHEEFWAVYLTGGNRVIERMRVSRGGVFNAIVDTKVIIKKALDLLATGLIIAHNHPSGSMDPSEEDIAITRQIKKATDIFDIKFIDHIIIGRGKSFSFLENKLL